MWTLSRTLDSNFMQALEDVRLYTSSTGNFTAYSEDLEFIKGQDLRPILETLLLNLNLSVRILFRGGWNLA